MSDFLFTTGELIAFAIALVSGSSFGILVFFALSKLLEVEE